MNDAPKQSAGGREPNGSGADAATEHFVRFRRGQDLVDLECALLLCAPYLHRAARRHCGASEAEDLVHDCLVVAIRRASEFEEPGRLLPWLLGIMHNLARSRHRWRWRRVSQEPTVVERERAVEGNDPTAAATRSEWVAAVLVHIRRLPPTYRLVVESHLVDGEPLVDIAARLARPPSTVRNQFQRGLQRLRRHLPAPMLAGVAAMLAARSASAGSVLPRRWTGMRHSLFVGAALLGILFVWPAAEVPSSPRAPVATAAATDSFARRVAESEATAGPGASTRTLASESEASVRLRLRFPNGDAAAGVPVILDSRFQRGLPVPRATSGWRYAHTDSQGEATFRAVRVGNAALRLHDMGILHEFEAAEAPRTFDFTIEFGVSMQVDLVDEDERPVEGGTILLSGQKGRRAPGYPAATTDGNGCAFVFSACPEFSVWARASGFSMSPSHVPRHRLDVPARTKVTLRLQRSTRRCFGRVETTSGVPIADATVAAWNHDGSSLPTYCFTDGRGRFEAEGMAPGPLRVVAVAPGHAWAGADMAAEDQETVLQLPRGGNVDGRISNGVRGRNAGLRVLTRSLDARGDPLVAVCGTVSNEGTFHLAALSAGRHMIGLFDLGSGPNAKPIPEQEVLVADGETTRVELAAEAAAGWAIHVVDSLDRPLAGCLVRSVSPLPYVGWKCTQSAVTDAEGIARLPSRDKGPWQLWVHAPGRSEPNVQPCISVGPVTPGSPMRITIPDEARQLGRIRGRLPAVWLEACGTTGLTLAGGFAARQLVVEQDGSFTAEGLPPGRYRLRSRLEDATGAWTVDIASVPLQPGEQLDLGTLPEVEWGEVTLELAAGGAVSPVPCHLRDGHGSVLESASMPADKPLRRRLPIGRYTLVFAASNAVPNECAFEVTTGADARIVLDRVPGVPCRFEVRSDTVEQSHVYATLQAAGASSACELLLERAANGGHWFVDIDLQPGAYEFSAKSGSGAEVRGTIVVSASVELHTIPFRMP